MAIDYCEDALGALLPDLDCSGSQRWQSSASFSDLDMDMTDSGTASWVGCDVLLEDEEYSSRLFCPELSLSQSATTIEDAFKSFHPHTTTMHSKPALMGCGSSQTASPATSDATPLGTLAPNSSACTAAEMHASSDATDSLLLAALAVPGASSRSGTPEPERAVQQAQPVLADYADADAVRLAALALQLSQGDANAAVTQLMAWAANP